MENLNEVMPKQFEVFKDGLKLYECTRESDALLYIHNVTGQPNHVAFKSGYSIKKDGTQLHGRTDK